jgi:hypothetical protein
VAYIGPVERQVQHEMAEGNAYGNHREVRGIRPHVGHRSDRREERRCVWEGLVNICVTAAEKALDTPPAGYTPVQRNSLTDVFSSMKATHRAIRLLVKGRR